MSRQAEVHNVKVGDIVKAIVKPVLESGGGATDIMVLTESVVIGVALMCIKLGGDEAVLDVMLAGAKQRLAEIRLTDLNPAGEA